MKYPLTNEGIIRACHEVESFLNDKKIDAKETFRIKMAAEEVLVNYQNTLGEGAEFLLDKGGSFGRKVIRLTVPGERIDPSKVGEYESEEDALLRNALMRMGDLPRWTYSRGANVVVFRTRRKSMPDGLKIAVAVVAACVLGMLVRLSPESVRLTICDGIVAPLLNTFLGFLNAVAGPMVFLSVVWGIYSLGDASTFSEVGKKLGLKFGSYLCLMSLAAAGASFPIFQLKFGHAQGGSGLSALYQMVLDIVPSNLFAPFVQGNTLQILFWAIIVGMTMLMISKNMQSVAELTEQLSFIVEYIMGAICKLIPCFVFGSVFNLVVSSELSTLAAGGRFFAAVVIGCAVLLILHTAICCLRLKISPVELWKRTSSTFIIAITTASSSAALPDNIRTCVDKLGISQRVANFGVPFAQILYKPHAALLFLCAAFCAAQSGLSEISVSWIIIAFVMSVVLSAAMPPVPGGMSAIFAILFAQLGLGTETLAVILSLSSILDFLTTATGVFSSQCVLAIAAKDCNKYI